MTELKKEAEEYLTQFYCLEQCYDIAIRECKNGERIRCKCFEIRLNCLTSFAEQVTKELQKENAELKSGCGMCYRKDKEQLTKAKVSLRKVIDYLGQFCSDYPDCVIEAEQFLKENE